jgi:hypothetical protein
MSFFLERTTAGNSEPLKRVRPQLSQKFTDLFTKDFCERELTTLPSAWVGAVPQVTGFDR